VLSAEKNLLLLLLLLLHDADEKEDDKHRIARLQITKLLMIIRRAMF